MKKIILTILTIISLLNISLLNISLTVNAEEEIGYVSDYVYLYDLNSKQVLIDKGSTEKIFPASMTKMMTLIVAIENLSDVDKTIIITEEMLAGLKEAHASRAGFDVGDEPRVIDLLYGVNLPSGADCTNALAIYITGSLSGFVDLMNQKAKEIGMNNTNFVNVTGLHDDNHYSTLQDIALLMEYGLKNELFKTIFTSSQYKSIPVLSQPEGLGMESTVFKFINNPDDPRIKYNVNIDGFLGGKSGYTGEARYCLASIAEKDGITYALITAHAWIERKIPSHIIDAGLIYNYYFDNYYLKDFYKPGDLIVEIPVNYNFFDNKIFINADEEIKKLINKNADIKIEVDVPASIEAPILLNETVGSLKIFQNEEIIYEKNLLASKKINRSLIAFVLTNIYWFIIKNHLKIAAFLIMITLLLLLIKKMISQAKS